MDAPGIVAQTVSCQACQQVVDLTGLAPFSQVRCPYCNVVMVVPVEFGNYLLFAVLGAGGMGTVYKALDLTLHRPIALKVLKPKLAADPEFIASFGREARAAAAVNHVNVCQVYSFGQHQGHYYIAMELLEQDSLDDRIAQQKKLDEETVLSIGIQVAQGLRAARQSGLLHRDVKPGNVLFNAEGLPKIVDFGLARASDTAVDQASGQPIWGTPYYIAPEKLLSHGDDVRSDIYSLGATLFHALAGRPPFEAATATDVAVKHTTQPVTSLKTFAPGVQESTARSIGRMLAKNPAERYQDYELLVADLEAALAQLRAMRAENTLVVSETGERVSVKSVVSTVAILVVGVLIAVVVVFNWTRLFGGKTGPAPGPGASTNAAVAVETDVNFNPALPVGRLWQTAGELAAQGNLAKAQEHYASIRGLLDNYPRHRQWVDLYEGLVLLAAGQREPAQALLARCTNATTRLENPATVSPIGLVSPLAHGLLGKTSLAEIQASGRQLPSWAEGVVNLAAGIQQLQAGQFKAAAASLQSHARTVTGQQRQWVLALQPLAGQLAAECQVAVTVLEDTRPPAASLAAVQTALGKVKNALVRAALLKREAELKARLGQ